ncbi:MAG: YeaH/YhbH family protein [Pseudomonadota bacterium]
MAQFIDRRLNPKDKNLGNRRRFIDRVRNHVKSAVDEAVKRRGIANADREGRVTVPADSISEPAFRHAREGGRRERVFTGNKQYHGGDRLNKPPSGGGGGRGRKGAKEGDGEDDFVFVLSREEFLDIFFEDLELPDLVKRTLKEIAATRPHRAGLSVTGSPGNMNVARTLRNAMGRRLALHRPTDAEIREIRGRIFELEAIAAPSDAQRQELVALRAELEARQARQKLVPYLDPLDVRYNHFEQRPEPNSNAVMFCLMDVSASMREREKDLAKRFFVLLHLFLMRRYDKVELVFIRHTHQASECDEETFFNSRETGGTVVSTALVEMKRIVEARYPAADWNIYAAQASDGDNYSGDSANCADLLENDLMPHCQYFAYVEIIDEEEAQFLTNDRTGTELWQAYRGVAETCPNFAMKRISGPGDIYPVFRELFSRSLESADG